MAINAIDNIIKFKGENSGRPSSSAGFSASGTKISAGLALGSGAIRGFAHIGVISELVKNGVAINELSGSSMGAILACLYASGADLGSVETAAREIGGDIIFDRIYRRRSPSQLSR